MIEVVTVAISCNMAPTISDTILHPHRLCMFAVIVNPNKDLRQLIHVSLWILLIFCGFLTNGLFLFTLLRNESLRRTSMNRLLMFLSAIDVLILLNEFLFIIYSFFVQYDNWMTSFKTPLVVTSVWVYTFFEHLSAGILIVIPYERFRGICFPLDIHSNSSLVKRYTILVTLVSIGYVTLFACVIYFVPGHALYVFLIFLTLPTAVTILISIISYAIITVVLLRRETSSPGVDQVVVQRRNEMRKRIILVLAINTLVYFILNILRKYFDTRLAMHFSEYFEIYETSLQFIDGVWPWASYMAISTMLNSMLNPIIYSMGSRQYREAMYVRLRCCL